MRRWILVAGVAVAAQPAPAFSRGGGSGAGARAGAAGLRPAGGTRGGGRVGRSGRRSGPRRDGVSVDGKGESESCILGEGAAISVSLFMLLVVLTLLYFWIFRREGEA